MKEIDELLVILFDEKVHKLLSDHMERYVIDAGGEAEILIGKLSAQMRETLRELNG